MVILYTFTHNSTISRATEILVAPLEWSRSGLQKNDKIFTVAIAVGEKLITKQRYYQEVDCGVFVHFCS